MLKSMKFSKAIQIKQWVNKFNQQRASLGYGRIEFNAEMFCDGKWSVSLSVETSGQFFSSEMERLFTLYAGGGFTIRVFTAYNVLVIDCQ